MAAAILSFISIARCIVMATSVPKASVVNKQFHKNALDFKSCQKPLFKKPKLRDNYAAAGLDCEDGAKLRRPVFGKRNVKKKVDNQDKELRTIGKENFKRGGENQLNHNYADKEIGISSKWGEENKIQRKDNMDHSFAYKATSSRMSKFKRPACDNVDHGFTSLGSSSVMTKLKRPASKWNDFLDDDNDLELEMSRFEETIPISYELYVSYR
ncbi:hypothetical protein CTI12_AA169830 [Artemisia annua]|uniref:Uncharacterized protein n=1 Tax=Artemisia annua TaxID=35608 RepID=A0A2U1PC68_ARTAN|nr:hypothetical protein CTI12_AA169830 [Artemisia annua]